MDLLTTELLKVALNLMEGLDSARSLTVAIMLRNRMWDELVQLSCDPRHYCDAEQYLRATAATDFLRKVSVAIPGIDPEAAAIEKWFAAERACFTTNRRLNELADFGTLNGYPADQRLLDFLHEVKKQMHWLLGDSPPSLFEGAFGPGATLSDGARQTSVMHKMSSLPTLTSSAWPYLVPWSGTKWATAVAARGEAVKFVGGNKFFSVPKTALTHRGCAKEPSINGFFQLGLGRCMRARLKKRGINLDSGQETHREIARAASITGDFATIDLSSASDTVCTALVRLATPVGWYHPLNDLRSRTTEVQGRRVVLEKFSSMGNGFTFELETAVFTAIALAVHPELTPGKDLFVYGDDIIVPTDVSSDVIWALKFCGFTPNLEKTFVTGPFRESCGGDFFNGVPVRAYFMKDPPNDPQSYIALANGIRRLEQSVVQAVRDCRPGITNPHPLRRCWFSVLDTLPSAVRACRGPVELGDLVVHDSEDRWSARWRGQIRYIRVWRPAKYNTAVFARFCPDVQFATALYGVVLHPQRPNPKWPDGYDGRGSILRDGVTGYKVGWVPFS